MHRQHRSLGAHTSAGGDRLKLPHFRNRQRICLFVGVDGASEFLGVNRSRFSLAVPDGKIQSDQRVTCPVQQPHRQTVMTGQDHPFPVTQVGGHVASTFQMEAFQPVLFLFRDLGEASTFKPLQPADGGQQPVLGRIRNAPENKPLKALRAGEFDEVRQGFDGLFFMMSQF